MTSSRSSIRFDMDNGRGSPSPMSSPGSPIKRGRAGHSRNLSTDSLGKSGNGKLRRSNTVAGSVSGGRSSTAVAVNVAVRVRPCFDLAKARESIIESMDDTEVTVLTSMFGGTQNTNMSGSKRFIFDRMFNEKTSQVDIFEYVKESIGNLIKGYNVSIMAYGQSGSGKSYTMGTAEGQEDESRMGVIARASRELFEELNGVILPGASSQDCPFAVSVTYLEIYNEQFRDLLNCQTPKQISIREDVKGDIIVNGLRELVVESPSQLLQILNQGSSIRQTNSTAINSQSSRSHAIFTIHLTQRQINPETGIFTTISSKLNFVDLAGSERLKNTNLTEYGRVKEGISINSGLTSLGKVISQLSTSETHISYRDSKLTRVLQDSLGGKALTYLIACITNESYYLSETVSTLTYAQRARSIQSTPTIQQIQSREDMLMTIENLKREVEYWKSRVEDGWKESVGGIDAINDKENRGVGNSISSPLTPLPIQSNTASPSIDQKQRLLRSEEFQQNVNLVIEDYEKTILSLQSSISEQRKYNEELNIEIDNKNQQLSDHETTIEDLTRYVTILENKSQTQFELLEEYEIRLNEPRPNSSSLVKSLEDRNNTLKSELDNHRKEYNLQFKESQLLTKQYNNSLKEIEVLTQKLEEQKQQIDSTDATMTEPPLSPPSPPTARKEYNLQFKESQLLTKQYNNSLKEIEVLTQKLEEQKQHIDSTDATITEPPSPTSPPTPRIRRKSHPLSFF